MFRDIFTFLSMTLVLLFDPACSSKGYNEECWTTGKKPINIDISTYLLDVLYLGSTD